MPRRTRKRNATTQVPYKREFRTASLKSVDQDVPYTILAELERHIPRRNQAKFYGKPF